MNTKQTNQVVPIDNALIEDWKSLFMHGDYSELGRLCNKPHNFIIDVFEKKKARKDIYEKIKKFYSDRSDFLNLQKKEAKKLNAA